MFSLKFLFEFPSVSVTFLLSYMYYFTLASLFFLSFVGRISPTPLYVFYPVTETFFFF